MHQIGEVEDIDEANEAKLKGLGISTTDDFLARAGTPAGRSELAGAIGVDAKEILVWANCADLMRIDGVGMQFADLLEAAGIDTIPELAQRNAANLHEKLGAVNAEHKLTGRAPTSAEVEAWIAQAKALPRVLEYSGGGAAANSAATPPPAASPPPAVAPTERAAAAVSAEPPVTAVAPAPVSAPPPVAAEVAPAAVSAAPPPVAATPEPASSAPNAGGTSEAVREFSRSDSLAGGRSWLQTMIDKLRGRA